jgi:hypothetical protein
MSKLPDKDLTVLQKSELVKKIAQVDSDAHELIYALVKCYYIEHNNSDPNIPYSGKRSKDKIEFDLLKFPNQLRQLLYKFVTVHIKKLQEDEKIKEIQDFQSSSHKDD